MIHLRLAAAAALVAALSSAAPAQPVVQEYPIPRFGAFPHDPAVGLDGSVWYTDQANSYIGHLDPETGSIVDYPTPTPNSGPHGITVSPEGYVWYTAQSTGRLGRVDPTTGQITEFVLPANASRPHTPIAHEGAIWFTAQNNSTYGRLDPANGQTLVYDVPAGSRPYGIYPAPDKSLWIALFGTNALARVDPATGAHQLYRLPSSTARPRRLTVTQDGFVWYTDYPRGYLGRLDPASGQVVEWRTPGGSTRPYGIATGPDGRVWFNASVADTMVAFDPLTQQMQSIPIPTSGSVVRHMVHDLERGRLWLALSGTRRLGKIQLELPVAFFGTACAGSLGVPGFEVSGVPRVGTTMTFDVTNTAAPVAALALGGSSTTWLALGLPFELTALGAVGCFVNSSWDVTLGSAPGPLALALPLAPALNGVAFYAQWVLLGDPSGQLVVTTTSMRAAIIGQ
jgi:virginiamycin B lyase